MKRLKIIFEILVLRPIGFLIIGALLKGMDFVDWIREFDVKDKIKRVVGFVFGLVGIWIVGPVCAATGIIIFIAQICKKEKCALPQ